MNDLDAMKRLWHEPQEWPEPKPIGKEELLTMIRSRTLEIRRATMARVRAESYVYVTLVVIPVAMVFASSGLTFRAMLAGVGLLTFLCPILGVLAYKEYRLRTLPLDGSLRQSLIGLVAAIDSTAHIYMATYMFCVIGGVALIAGLLGRRYGVTWILAAWLLGGAVFLRWAHRSGQAYVRGMFRNERLSLLNAIHDLETS